MTNKNHHDVFLMAIAILASSFSFAPGALSFPENVRYGYASCTSCHISPTGGGLLTPYGKGASSEFLSTWKSKKKEEESDGSSWFLYGGDFRALAFQKDNHVYKEKGVIPMQIEGQAGANVKDFVTFVGSLGIYDKDAQVQNIYGIANIGENYFVRAGKFFPAFGIALPDHTSSTRRGLGFNEGQQSMNAELGYLNESGEFIVDAILSHSGEISSEEKGVSAKAAYYAGGKSQIGLSVMSVKGSVWQRNVYGAFVTTGITKSSYFVGELDQEKKTPFEDDPSTLASTRIVTTDKIGWEFKKGMHVIGTYDSAIVTSGESYDSRWWSAGPGFQWYPTPHLDLLLQYQQRIDETWSNKPGYLATLMAHYYL